MEDLKRYLGVVQSSLVTIWIEVRKPHIEMNGLSAI